MRRRTKTKKWLQNHVNDPYVKQAQKDGYRSRAAYKLLEINQKYRLFKRGLTVIDLGAAPGGWSQIAVEKVGKEGKVVAIDVLPMKPIPHVDFILGDIRETEATALLSEKIKGRCGLVISDIAPNITGIRDYDQAQAVKLWGMALAFAQRHLSQSGAFLIKVFHGEGFDEYLKTLKSVFGNVTVCKPKASRDQSREVYILSKILKSTVHPEAKVSHTDIENDA